MDAKELLRLSGEINQIKDLDAVLDRILREARRLVNADAGSIYLVEGNELVFRYVQNDTLFRDGSNRMLYTNAHLAINNSSIVGFVANHRQPLVIADAYKLPADVPYSFNPQFDEKTGYRTRSIMTVPLISGQEVLTGVMQIINRKNESGDSVAFTDDDRLFISYFAETAASAIERAKLTREMILRMIRMAELRDPKETGSHVNRVGAYAIEMYRAWAEKKGIASVEIGKFNDNLRIAAMLHDVGKVGIPDTILKKPGRYNEEERAIIQEHVVLGYHLFADKTAALDIMSAEICLNHHEKWDGTGYPGRYQRTDIGQFSCGPGKRGEEIPLVGRIVAVADVYDALSQARCYKEAWEESQVLDILKKDSGTHFDPELIAIFFEIYDIILAIRAKYREN